MVITNNTVMPTVHISNHTLLMILFPPHFLLRFYPHCGECDEGDGGGERLEMGSGWAWSPTLQAR